MGEKTNFISGPIIVFLKRLVADAGGEWCGVQESIAPNPPLLMFTSRKTGSTLAVPINNPEGFDGPTLFKAVAAKIAESNAKFADRPISIKASVLKNLSNRLMQLVNEIDALYLREKKCPTPSKTS